MRVIATAGHVDHGKSTLIRALTGINPDRWVEEQERGLTIDLGFAHMQLPDGQSISFIDVPGHIRFLANMLAGVGGINGCLLIVDAREGWMPQTEEHLRILEMVGVHHGIIVLTKIDLCDADDCELAELDIAEHVMGTFLESAQVVRVSAISGAGIETLITALVTLAITSVQSPDHSRPRLFIDRVFAPKGSGTVITGTLVDGAFSLGDTIVITPHNFAGRIRGIQTLGQAVDHVGPGNRVALNIAGIEHTDVVRGHVVIKPNQWFTSDRLDASLQILSALNHRVSRRGAYTVHIGSDEIPSRLRVLGPDSLGPGDHGFVRLHLARALPLLPGDRFVLRESGRSETVGGGEILDINPQLPASRAQPDRSLDRVIAERGWTTVDEIRLLTGVDMPAVIGDWVVAPEELQKVRRQLIARVAEADASGVDIAHFNDHERAVIPTIDELEVSNGRARPKGLHDPLLEHRIIQQLAQQGCAPSAPSGVSNDDLRRLVKLGLLFERDAQWFHISALEKARRMAQELLALHPDGFTLAQFRDALGITRKHALPLATELDARGMTRRREDLRIAGPKLGHILDQAKG